MDFHSDRSPVERKRNVIIELGQILTGKCFASIGKHEWNVVMHVLLIFGAFKHNSLPLGRYKPSSPTKELYIIDMVPIHFDGEK